MNVADFEKFSSLLIYLSSSKIKNKLRICNLSVISAHLWKWFNLFRNCIASTQFIDTATQEPSRTRKSGSTRFHTLCLVSWNFSESWWNSEANDNTHWKCNFVDFFLERYSKNGAILLKTREIREFLKDKKERPICRIHADYHEGRLANSRHRQTLATHQDRPRDRRPLFQFRCKFIDFFLN